MYVIQENKDGRWLYLCHYSDGDGYCLHPNLKHSTTYLTLAHATQILQIVQIDMPGHRLEVGKL